GMPRAHPVGRVRARLHPREPRRRADAQRQAPVARRARHREGGREAARDDAVDQEEQARGYVQKLGTRHEARMKNYPHPVIAREGWPFLAISLLAAIGVAW